MEITGIRAAFAIGIALALAGCAAPLVRGPTAREQVAATEQVAGLGS